MLALALRCGLLLAETQIDSDVTRIDIKVQTMSVSEQGLLVNR